MPALHRRAIDGRNDGKLKTAQLKRRISGSHEAAHFKMRALACLLRILKSME